MNNTTNFTNPVNTFVTGEVIVERNENNPSKFFSLDFFYKNLFFSWNL